MKKRNYLIAIVFHLLSLPLISQFGVLDTSFGLNGVVQFETGDLEYGTAIVSQPDHKIVVVGTTFEGTEADMLLMRINEDGSIDSTFNNDGVITWDFNGLWDKLHAVCIQPDGKILVGGTTEFNFMDKLVLMRFLPNGIPDITFNGTGVIMFGEGYHNSSAKSIVVQNDGKIVVTGFHGTGVSDFNAITFRFNPNGTPDTSFGVGGKLEEKDFQHTRGTDVKLLPDGNLIVCGYIGNSTSTYHTILIKYKPDGIKDSLFGDDGRLILTDTFDLFSPPHIAIQDSNKFLVARSINGDFSVSRYHAENGLIDTSFGINGFSIHDINGEDNLWGIALQSDGKIILSGFSENNPNKNIICARLHKDGQTDNTFGSNGFTVTDIGVETEDVAYGLCIQNNGKIVLTGYSRDSSFFKTIVLRYDSGITVGTYNVLEKVLTGKVFPNPTNRDLTLTYNLQKPQNTWLNIFNEVGSCVYSQNESHYKVEGTHYELLNTANLISGMYFVQLITENEGILVKKFIKE